MTSSSRRRSLPLTSNEKNFSIAQLRRTDSCGTEPEARPGGHPKCDVLRSSSVLLPRATFNPQQRPAHELPSTSLSTAGSSRRPESAVGAARERRRGAGRRAHLSSARGKREAGLDARALERNLSQCSGAGGSGWGRPQMQPCHLPDWKSRATGDAVAEARRAQWIRETKRKHALKQL